MAKYWDLLITDQDLTLDYGGMVERCNNRLSIAQDIKHALLESGLVTELLGERSAILRNDVYLQIELLIEEDERIEPGTVVINQEDLERLFVTAETVEGEALDFEVLTNGREF